jgi:Outer membrane lipoprotein carrier protein LolA-like
MSDASELMHRSLSVVALTVMLMAPEQAISADNCTLSDLLALRAEIREDSAAFTQERRIHYVRDPLLSSGYLRFIAPDHLEMIVGSPEAESFIYDDGVLSFNKAGEEHTDQVSVDSNLLLSAMFSGLIGTLSGNEGELKRVFFVKFEAGGCNWRLNLIPKSKRVLEKVLEIELRGMEQHIDEVEIRQANGDHSILRITEQQ